MDPHDGGGGERLAVRSSGLEREVETVEIRGADLLDSLLAERGTHMAIEEEVGLVAGGFLMARDRQPFIGELLERDRPSWSTACGGLGEQFAFLLFGFTLGLAAGSWHGGVEVPLGALGVGSGVHADLEAVTPPPNHPPTIRVGWQEGWHPQPNEEGPLRRGGLTCTFVERTTGFEPATPTLARLCSTN